MRAKVINLYIFFILGIYPFLMHNGFVDISKTKSDIFIVSTGFVFLLCIIISALEKDWQWLCEKKNWIIYLLIMAIGISTVNSIYPEQAFTGEAGRYQGALVCLAYCLAALCILNFGEFKKYYIEVVILAGTLVSFIAILNFYEIDIFGTLLRIKENLRHAYISTIGHINIYAAYLSIVVPAAIVSALTEKNKWKKYRLYVCLIVLFCGMIVSSCDSVYITLGVLFVFLPFGCLHEFEKRKTMSEILVIFGTSLFVNSLVNQILEYPLEYADGMNRHFANPVLAGGVFFVCVLVDVCVSLTKKISHNIEKQIWNKGWSVFIGLTGIIGSCIYITNTTFDYRWGSYRGLIWSQGWDFYIQQPLKEKLFGIGLDMIFPVFYRFYGYDGMIVDEFAFYDNLHNEYLQYLVTTGLLGLSIYLIAIGLCMYHLYKSAKNNENALAIFMVMLCYLIQSFTNISMCCVTAIVFLLLFLGQKISPKPLP